MVVMATTPDVLAGRLPVREAARRCHRTPETIRRWVWDGRLPAEKIGGHLYIRESDLPRAVRDPPRAREQQVLGQLEVLDRLERLRHAVRNESGSLSVIALLDAMRGEPR